MSLTMWTPSSSLLGAVREGEAPAEPDGLALGEIRHTHLRFGELDLYQWILFVAEHEKRHVAQLRQTLLPPCLVHFTL